MEMAELKSEVSNYCKNCGKAIPKSLTFCSKKCLDEFKEKHSHRDSSQENISYVEVENLFTKFANSKGKEREKLGKIIDNNCKLAKQYMTEVQLAYEMEPDLPKFSFQEWLDNRRRFSNVKPDQKIV